MLSMRIRGVLLFAVILPLVYVARHAQIDDSYIYARYISNALAGNGLVFNAGEHVNALTSPLYAYMLLLMSWLLQGHILLAQSVLSFVGMLGACYLAERQIPFSGLVIAAAGYFYSMVGMETAWFLFFIMLSITLYLEEKYNWLPVALVLLCLTRFEGGALLLVLAWQMYKQRRLPRLASLIPAVSIAAAYAWANHHMYGKFLPSSTVAKIGQGISGYWGGWGKNFILGAVTLTDSHVYSGILIIAVIAGIVSLKSSPLNRVVLPFAGILLAFYLGFSIPGYGWYYAPFVMFGCIYGTHSLLKTGVRPWMLALGVMLQMFGSAQWLRHQGSVSDYIAASQWIDANTPKGATVEACEIGDIGWFSHRRLNDILGLTTPKNAVHIAHKDDTSWLAEDRPDYVVVHYPAWPYEQVAASSKDYEELSFHSGDVHILRRTGNQQISGN